MYCWQIYDRNHKRSHVVDAADANRSNWMRYVNCARNWKEQNLLAYQYQGQLYYRTIKIIPRFTELMVFYGSEFANTLHINLRNYNSPPGYAQKFGAPAAKKPKLDIQKEKIQEVTPDKSKRNLQAKDQEEVNLRKPIKNPINKKALRTITVRKDLTNETNNNIINKNKELQNENNSEPLQCTINTNNDDFKCKNCNYKGINSHDIKRHSIKHNNIKERLYKCDICDSCFSQKSNLKNHIRTHTGEKPYKCDICENSFSLKHHFKYHIRTHTGEKPYKCDVCESRFRHSNTLKYHIMRIQAGKLKKKFL
ncbi:putative histone-lysine N-methyltransferase PRDM6 [Spodoptera litura]|uniref:Histone-lysine N-methyltransferase PRDM6 n=1 Tax=Spodoptera litura TaxID=69820 RepID=A0A9J7ELE4_SPOLT|nr:putative histone-lysine N-methyltransferase PRDM6 [Spodoptera litura]